MATRVTGPLRIAVAIRAHWCCEYCLVPEDDEIQPFHVDHIISEKHDGETELANGLCVQPLQLDEGNRRRDIRHNESALGPAIQPALGSLGECRSGEIVPLTPVGVATVRLLRINDAKRIGFRSLLAAAGRHPRI